MTRELVNMVMLVWNRDGTVSWRVDEVELGYNTVPVGTVPVGAGFRVPLGGKFWSYTDEASANAGGWYRTKGEAARAAMAYYDNEARKARARADLLESMLAKGDL